MKNKRGDIPIVILVIGVFAICGLIILSFVYSDKFEVKSDDLKISLLEKISMDLEKFYFYINIGDSKETAASKIGAKVEGEFLIIEEQNDVLFVKYEEILG